MRPWATQCTSPAMMPRGAADAEAHGDEPHVLARAVGQLALEVVLLVHLEGRVAHRQHAKDHHDRLGERRAYIGRRQNIEAQHDEDGAFQKHAGEQGRHRARRLGVGIGQPGVHGEQARFGPETDGREHERDHHEGSIHERRVGQDGRPEHRLVRIGHDVSGVRVDEQCPEQAEGHAGRADDDVLPRRLQGELRAVDADEEHRGERRGLHRHPHHDDVVGGDGEDHREHEQTEEGIVLLHLGGPELAVGHVVGHIGQRVHARAGRDNGDEPQEQRTEAVEMEPLPQSEDVAARKGGHHQQEARYRDARQGEHVNGFVDTARGRFRRQHGDDQRRRQRAAQKHQK